MVCCRANNSGRSAKELRQMGSSQTALVLVALIMSTTLVRGALWCDNGGSKSSYIDRGLDMHPVDVQALEALRDGLKETNHLLDNWNSSSHPCEWCGVLCMCNYQLYPSYMHASCPEGGRFPDVERVFGIDLGSGARPSGLGLTGPLPTEIGLLSEAKLLYFHGNSMTGTLPSELGNLANLRRILFRDCSFTGSLPPELGQTRLKDLFLDGNKLEGSVPPKYCDLLAGEDLPLGALVLTDNVDLCGELPGCFNSSQAITADGLVGSCLIHPLNPNGGFCDKTAPECVQAGGCLSTPAIAHRLDLIQFNVSGFVDAQSGIKAIRWRLGTKPGLEDAKAETQNLPPDALMLEYSSSTVHLVNGLRYYVTVTVVNGACPEVTTDFFSAAILADSTPPEPVMINDRVAVYMSANCTYANQQADKSQLNVCWAEFEDKESSVAKYEVQFIQTDGDGNDEVLSPFTADNIFCSEGFCRTEKQMALLPGGFYSAVVRAYNDVQSFTDVQTTDLHILVDEPPYSDLVVLLLMLIGLCIIILLTALFHVGLKRKKVLLRVLVGLREVEVLEQDLQDTFEACIGGPSAGSITAGHSHGCAMGSVVDIFTLSEVVFVFTDIQDSTSMSAFDGLAMKHVQDVHDSVIRHQIALNSGYEMNTQGDSFEIAFGSVHCATRFCLGVQLELLHANWSKSALRLPSCGVVRDANGKLVFAGPRVRMGIHLAKEGTFAIFRHHLTKHVQFDGPAVKLAAKIGDSAAGGQIVMSMTTLYSNERVVMKLAVLKLLGQFIFEVPPQGNVQVGVFTVLPPPLGKMPSRDFSEPLRGCEMVEMGEGLQLISPPTTKDDNGLAVVFINMEEATDAVNKAVDLHVASFAQQFHGYKLQQTDRTQLVYMFQMPMEAVHFGMILQVALMAAPWENIAPADLRIERNPQGKIIYRGPRVGVLVHSSRDIAVNNLQTPPLAKTFSAEPQLTQESKARTPRGRLSMGSLSFSRSFPRRKATISDIEMGIEGENEGSVRRGKRRGKSYIRIPLSTRSSNYAEYSGDALRDAEVLSALVHPGQLVVTEAVWKGVQGGLPALAQVISLGVHEVPDLSDLLPQTLTELSPSCISQRSFPRVPSHTCLVPGYRQAPDVDEDLTSMFCNVMSCPAAPEGIDQVEFTRAYDTSVVLWSELVRRLLTEFNGYECKEPERGKFTLAFKNFKHAVGFAVTIQSALMDLEYPPLLLLAEECAEVRLEADETLLYRGLRVKIGMAHGRASLKKPIQSTGRADYYGILPNTAARLMSVTPPGQILTDGTFLHDTLNLVIPRASELLRRSTTSRTERISKLIKASTSSKTSASMVTLFSTPEMGASSSWKDLTAKFNTSSDSKFNRSSDSKFNRSSDPTNLNTSLNRSSDYPSASKVNNRHSDPRFNRNPNLQFNKLLDSKFNISSESKFNGSSDSKFNRSADSKFNRSADSKFNRSSESKFNTSIESALKINKSADSLGSNISTKSHDKSSGSSGGEEKRSPTRRPAITRFDQFSSQFERVLSPIETAAGMIGPLIAKGYGVYTLKGVPDPKPLVQLSMVYLAGRGQKPEAQRA